MSKSVVSRRTALAAALCASVTRSAWAQLGRQLRIMVPFPAGGTADVLPRIVAQEIGASYPGGVVIENRSGAGGNIGAETVFHSAPDGATLLMSPPGPIAINQALYPQLTFDPALWVPVTILATVPNVMDVSPRLAGKDFKDLLAYIRANPGQVTYASQGNGSTSHLTANLFMSLTGTRMVHVPYKGTAPALVALISQQVDLFFDNLSSSAHYDRAGKLRIVAVADKERDPALPEVPTFAELGLPGMEAVTWFGVMAPPGTPAAVVQQTYEVIHAALQKPELRAKFAQQGAVPRGWTPEETAVFVKAETRKWGGIVRQAHVTIG